MTQKRIIRQIKLDNINYKTKQHENNIFIFTFNIECLS